MACGQASLHAYAPAWPTSPASWSVCIRTWTTSPRPRSTRAWLERDNRAAFAQTLERMLDAVRLGYWKPDAPTRRELLGHYAQALRASDLAQVNPAVRRFALEALAAKAADRSPAADSPSPMAQAAPAPVQGLCLRPQPPAAPAREDLAAMAVARLGVLWGVACLLLLGAWRHSRRWLRAGESVRAAA